ncbi:MAG TPA: hypothetical protein PJ994_08705 [Tepidiformaceae bacterium]|nr:hypothetical protein [Tepidiformaceae bacterium]HMO94567.1 hypothetical protein [Tepidiformaceae bacterium]
MNPEAIMAEVQKARPYTLVVLRRGPNYETTPGVHMDHLRHIFAMRAAGEQILTLPVTDPGEIAGIGLMATADKAAAEALIAADPAVRAGRLTYEIVSCMALPGDAIPQ